MRQVHLIAAVALLFANLASGVGLIVHRHDSGDLAHTHRSTTTLADLLPEPHAHPHSVGEPAHAHSEPVHAAPRAASRLPHGAPRLVRHADRWHSHVQPPVSLALREAAPGIVAHRFSGLALVVVARTGCRVDLGGVPVRGPPLA